MISALLFIAVASPTLTFTHTCAKSNVVLEALGKELGVQIKPGGSVRDDYFLVRFVDVPVGFIVIPSSSPRACKTTDELSHGWVKVTVWFVTANRSTAVIIYTSWFSLGC